MSVEPPPPDWVTSDAAFHDRRSILDGESARPTQSIPRVVLEETPDGERRNQTNRLAGEGRLPPVEPGGGENVSRHEALIGALRRWSDDVAYSTLRRSQLVALLGFVAVLALATYGWQRGTLSSGAADGPLVAAGDAPAAPRLSSDQVAWNDIDDGADRDGRRSTASFASDGAFPDRAGDHEPNSGAKLFVADGRKSSKRVASNTPGDEPTDRASGDTGDRTPVGTTPLDPPPTGGKRTATTVAAAVRYESCAEAAAAGAAPIRLGEPGYRLSLDRDKDGIACENGSTPEDPGDAPVDSSHPNPTVTVPSQPSTTTTAPSAGPGTTSVAEATTTSQTSTTSRPTTTDPTATTTTTVTTTGSTQTTSTPTSTGTTSSTTSSTTTSTTVGSTTVGSTTSSTTTRPSTSSTTVTTALPSTSSTTTTTTISTTTTIG